MYTLFSIRNKKDIAAKREDGTIFIRPELFGVTKLCILLCTEYSFLEIGTKGKRAVFVPLDDVISMSSGKTRDRLCVVKSRLESATT